jgi:hypothetical protein
MRKDPGATHFFFREEGNYHCAACPRSYKGHPTAGTGHQRSKIYTWALPKGFNGATRVAWNRYCTGYKKSDFKKRTVEQCLAWVRSVDPSAKHFFFRSEGNYHCSPCPSSYAGSNTGTGVQNSHIYTYAIGEVSSASGDSDQAPTKVAHNRFCHNYKNNKMDCRSVDCCMNHVKRVDSGATHFFFRE